MKPKIKQYIPVNRINNKGAVSPPPAGQYPVTSSLCSSASHVLLREPQEKHTRVGQDAAHRPAGVLRALGTPPPADHGSAVPAPRCPAAARRERRCPGAVDDGGVPDDRFTFSPDLPVGCGSGETGSDGDGLAHRYDERLGTRSQAAPG
jgi:hypothetical protein